MKIEKSWLELKELVENKVLVIQYKESETEYFIWATENGDEYYCIIDKETGSTNQIDFEGNYKAKANSPIIPKSDDKKQIVRAESRPINHTTCFTGAGDSDTEIGGGKQLIWNFSNNDDELDMGDGSTIRRKRLEFSFKDPIYVKEGTVYYHGISYGSYLDMMVVCPKGQYYYDNDNNVHLAAEDTIISHYVIKHPIYGNVYLGDELNTEGCSSQIPVNYKFWIDITVPSEDVSSHGAISLEIYRKRTVIL